MAGPLTVPLTPPHDPETPWRCRWWTCTQAASPCALCWRCPEVAGPTLLAKRRYMRQHLTMCGDGSCLNPGARDMAELCWCRASCPTRTWASCSRTTRATVPMCGHAVLALGRFALDFFGLVPLAPIRRPRGTGQHPLPVRAGGRLRGVRGRRSRGPVLPQCPGLSCWPQVTCRTLPALLSWGPN